jgi:ABC-2 type transport system ATP-binding protein
MSRIGTLIEAPGIYPNLSASENLKLKCLAMGVRKKGIIEDLLITVGLQNTGKKKVKNFSLGMKQRLGIALALVGDPDLVILDEPINGLDPQGIAEVREMLSKLNREKNITFIISSHILEELSKIAINYGIIHDGELLQEMTREELLAKCSERIELKTNDTRKACTVLDEMGITKYKVVDVNTIQIFERLNDSGDITMALAENGVKTMGISVKNEALEDYYLNLTGGAANV